MTRLHSRSGFVLPVALLVVLGIATAVAAVSAHVAALQAARQVEQDAARRDSLLEAGLGDLLAIARTEYAPVSRVELGEGVVGRIETRPDGETLYAYTEVSAGPVWEWRGAVIQRGADGLDLPRAAVVGQTVSWDPDRSDPVVQTVDGDEGEPPVRVVTPPIDLGGVNFLQLRDRWRLDEGTQAWLLGAFGGAQIEGGPRLIVIEPGELLPVTDLTAASPGDGSLIVVVALDRGVDARNLGELTGVIIASGGDVLLDGTQVQGAVVATGTIDFGATGSVRWDPEPWLACTDRLVPRLRLAPGSLEFGFRDEPLLTPVPAG